MKKEFHYVIIHESVPYFGEIQYLSLLSKLYCYPDFIHTIWTNDVNLLERSSMYMSLSLIASDRQVVLRVKNLYETYDKDICAADKVRWGMMHKNPKRALAYVSDYYRFMILRDFGGVYSDLDCISLKRYPFESKMKTYITYHDSDLNEYKHKVQCIIGTQTSHRYKGTSIHFIASEPGSAFIETYIKLRNQMMTGSAQCGYHALEHLDAFSTTLVLSEITFSDTIQDNLLKRFTPEKVKSFRKKSSSYELHIPGPEGKYLIKQSWFMDFIRSLVDSLNY